MTSYSEMNMQPVRTERILWFRLCEEDSPDKKKCSHSNIKFCNLQNGHIEVILISWLCTHVTVTSLASGGLAVQTLHVLSDFAYTVCL